MSSSLYSCCIWNVHTDIKFSEIHFSDLLFILCVVSACG